MSYGLTVRRGGEYNRLALPPSYPLSGDGEPVGHDVCQQIGQRAYEAAHTGIASRSAATRATSSDEQLALFEGHAALEVKERRPFTAWYLGLRGRSG